MAIWDDWSFDLSEINVAAVAVSFGVVFLEAIIMFKADLGWDRYHWATRIFILVASFIIGYFIVCKQLE